MKVWKTLISCALICCLLLGMLPAAFADQTQTADITVYKDGAAYPLRAIKHEGRWFADMQCLADLAGCECRFNTDQNMALLFRRDPVLILYKGRNGDWLNDNGTYYVNCSDAAHAIGLFFDVDEQDHVSVTVLRTPADLRNDMERIMLESRYHLYELINGVGAGWGVAETAARTYALNPFSGDYTILQGISGQAELERYRHAIARILSTEGDMTDLLESMADVDSGLSFGGKLLSKGEKFYQFVQTLLEKNSKLTRSLRESGAYDVVYSMFGTQFDPYDEMGDVVEFLEGYHAFSDTVSVPYFLSMITFAAAVENAEESLIRASGRIAENSSNGMLKKAVQDAFITRFDDGTLSNPRLYGGWLNHTLFDSIAERAKDYFYGPFEFVGIVGSLLISEAIEYCFGTPSVSDMSDAIINYSVCNQIQMEASDYYFRYRDDSAKGTPEEMRAVVIFYLRAAMAGYEGFSCDESLKQALDNAKTTLEGEIQLLLGYDEMEYDPDISANDALLLALESDSIWGDTPHYQVTPGSSYDSSLFDETYWHLCFGQTLGTNAYALFHSDGTFIAQSMGSGLFDTGTYSYDGTTLKLNFWLCERDCEFVGGGDSFTSRVKYPMQVGEDFYYMSRISPDDDMIALFAAELNPSQPPEQPSAPPQDPGSVPQSGSDDMLYEAARFLGSFRDVWDFDSQDPNEFDLFNFAFLWADRYQPDLIGYDESVTAETMSLDAVNSIVGRYFLLDHLLSPAEGTDYAAREQLPDTIQCWYSGGTFYYHVQTSRGFDGSFPVILDSVPLGNNRMYFRFRVFETDDDSCYPDVPDRYFRMTKDEAFRYDESSRCVMMPWECETVVWFPHMDSGDYSDARLVSYHMRSLDDIDDPPAGGDSGQGETDSHPFDAAYFGDGTYYYVTACNYWGTDGISLAFYSDAQPASYWCYSGYDGGMAVYFNNYDAYDQYGTLIWIYSITDEGGGRYRVRYYRLDNDSDYELAIDDDNQYSFRYFETVSLDFAPDCRFFDERHERTEISFQEFKDIAAEELDVYFDLTVTVTNGRITECVVPYFP